MFLKRFDVFPKISDPDVKVKTKAGAFLSILTLLAMTILFFHELYRFLVPRIFDEVVVDTSRVGLQRSMPINFNMTIYSPCSNFKIDAWDIEGNQQVNYRNEVHLQRIDENGLAIGGNNWMTMKKRQMKGREKDLQKKMREESPSYCGSCYGAGAKGQCCNTCDDVIEAFKAKGWSLAGIDRWEQCISEGYTNFGKESCLISGFIRVSRIKGTLFFSVLDDIKPGSKSVHDISRISKSLNLSHTFHDFEFGQKVPGSKHPLDGITVLQEEKGRMKYTYHINIVPTRFFSRRGIEINTFKFTPVFTQKLITEDKSIDVPGIFFKYDIAPLSVISKETSYSVWQLITSVCAIVGGAFTCASLVDQFFFQALSTLEGKRRIGKVF